MIDKKYLPSKNFQIALLAAVSIILLTLVFIYWKPSTTRYINNNLVANTNATSSLMDATDSDKDGLPDWLENLYGTNPKLADTDNDGTIDIEEIKANRDPLKANTAPKEQEPNDKIDPQLIASEQQASEEYQSISPTEKMARNLMSNVIASQPLNGEMDQTTIDNIVQKTIEDLPVNQFSGITKESDLNFISTDSKTFDANILTYAKSYSTQTEVFRKIMGQDLSIINDSMTNSTVPEKEKMTAITKKYQTIINNLVKMPLPATPGSYGAIYHLAIINGLEKLISIDNDMINLSGDVSSLFSDLTEYAKIMNDLTIAFSKIDSTLKIQRQ